ncbi:MAG TPA: pentapeptide repeat-containing protein, partial [Acidimicrobiales bacterium]|nr:pentapeptide repeat-containing protein [Acidimicrobiales bacterium]
GRGGYLIGADANLTNASLSGANLQSVNAQGATFTGADLNDANLTNDYLFEANFDDATFSGATLTGANLRAATATGASLQAAILTDTTLDGADFTGADFTGADLSDSLALNTIFTNATFTNADLNGTNFTDANFSGATFSGATFSGAILTNADLNGADLSSADLTNVKSGGITGTPASLPSGWTLFNGYLVGAGANLRGAKLSGADLAGANLSDADFNVASLSGADLVGTNLSDANLGDTNFTGANLTDAEIIGADLDGADLLNADLSGADFAGSNLSNATFTGTTGDATADVTGVEWDDTTCPDGTNSNDDDFTCLGHGFFSPLVLTKTTSATGYGAAGQVIPYSYLVTNTGSETLTGVAVSDNLVATVTCPAGTLGPGANENCTGSYTVSQGDVDAGSVTNTAVASASDSEGLVTSAPSSATVSATTANSSIILTKSTTSTGFGAAGQIIAYSYLVTNTGTTTLIGVGVSDDLVATVSCPAGTLAPGATEACTGSYTVSQGDVDAGSVTNTATASATNPHSTVVTSAPSSVTVLASNCDPPAITSADTATAVSRIPFSFTVRSCSTSVPVIKGAHLPFGVRLVDNRNGTATISGIPAARDAGIYTATITATVKSQPVATQSFALTVDNTPAFKSKATYTATTGVAFAYPITTRSGYPVPTITTPSTLPGGVTLNDTDPANGTATLGGTPDPNAGGIYVITITATNGIGAPVNQTFTLTVYQGPAITSGDSYTTVAGQPMTPFTVTATGYPVPTLKASGLPPGVKLTDNKNLTGTISGTPKSTAAGTYTVTITASSKAGTTTQTFTLLVT